MSRAFQGAGHKLTLVRTDVDLRAALQAGVADVVIADLADASSLPGTRFPVVAVVAKGDREAIEAAKRFDALVKAPAKPDTFLDAVDHALEGRASKNSKNLR
jgi:hypothetical protein